MSDEPKKVLIAMPTLGLDPDPDKWLTTLLRIIADIRRNGMSYAFHAPYRKTWWPSNNQIWSLAFEGGFDYILRIDDDIHSMASGSFSRLLEADKDVIGASYPIRQFPYSMCAFDRTDKAASMIESWKARDKNPAAMTEVRGEGVLPCDLIGFGMTLIRVEPFKALNRAPMYQGDECCPDDTYFAQICADNGIQQFVHLDVKLCHREITPLNRIYLFNAEARAMLKAGIFQPGNEFHDRLINTFGADGMKDFSQLKGMEVQHIITR